MILRDKILSYAILIIFILIGFLYWFNVIAMHYIFGGISLFLLFGMYVFSLIKKIKIPKKNVISFILSLLILVSVFIIHFMICNNPFTYHYRKVDNGVKITGYTCNIANNYNNFNIDIPSHIRGMEVKVIGERAFAGSTDFASLIIPNTIEIIEAEAFAFTDISNIYLSNSLKYIENKAFYNSSFTYVTIPNSVCFIGSDAFKFIDIIAIEENSTISRWASNWTNAYKLYYDSVSIKKIDGIVYILHIDKTATVSSIYNNFNKMVILDEIVYNNEKYSVTTIDRGAGLGNWFEEIIIPNSITTIRSRAFSENDKLKKVFIPNNVLYMENNIFDGCTNLIINTQYKEKPDGWDENWNNENLKVNWNVSHCE